MSTVDEARLLLIRAPAAAGAVTLRTIDWNAVVPAIAAALDARDAKIKELEDINKFLEAERDEAREGQFI
jgi:hypothetical protein